MICFLVSSFYKSINLRHLSTLASLNNFTLLTWWVSYIFLKSFLTWLALFELSTLSAKTSTWRYSSRINTFLAPWRTKLMEKYGSYSFSFKHASTNFALNVMAHFYLLDSFSCIISQHDISLMISSFYWESVFSISSSSSTTPLNA